MVAEVIAGAPADGYPFESLTPSQSLRNTPSLFHRSELPGSIPLLRRAPVGAAARSRRQPPRLQ